MAQILKQITTFYKKMPRLFWIEVCIVALLAILIYYSYKKQGLIFSLQFFLAGFAWGVLRSILYFTWRYEFSPPTLLNFQKISFLLVVASLIIWYFSLVLAKKIAGFVIYDKGWNKKFIFSFFLFVLVLQVLIDYWIYKLGYIRVKIPLTIKFHTFWPYVQSVLLSLESLFFIWAIRHARYFCIKRNQGSAYTSAVSLLYLPFVLLSGFFFLGLFNFLFRYLS